MTTDPEPWPLEIRLISAERRLEVDFEDGAKIALPAEYLRVESPSAEVQGHGSVQKRIVPGKRAVAILAVEPVGNYAVRLRFDDGHETGIYTWRYLLGLAQDHDQMWTAYLEALEARGLSRDT